MGYQLGLDTGGTYTDAVLVDESLQVVAKAKSLTTHASLIDGLRGAVDAVLAAAPDDARSDVSLVSLSTTLATNALVEGRGRSVCLILIGFKAAQLERANLREALGSDPLGFIDGGHDASGQPLCELDRTALGALVQKVDGQVDAYAVCSVFATRNPEHELAVLDTVQRATGKPVSCGHQLSSALDAPRRALTALLNARLIPLIGSLLSAARTLLDEQSIEAALMVVKGDGSLVSEAVARQCPVETILSGPAASVVGAGFLNSGSSDDSGNFLVSDMGGTTTDIACIVDGEPRLSASGATVGGFQTMVRAIEVSTFGLGGDSHLHFDRELRDFVPGPQRVVPLSLLLHQHPKLMSILEWQLERSYANTYDAQFVMAHVGEAKDLSALQSELYARIAAGPIALTTLFEEQSLERALARLEQRALVLRAAFTPTDASHVTGHQRTWARQPALLAATLMMRYSAENLGPVYASPEAFAQVQRERVSRETALALVEVVSALDQRDQVLRASGQRSSAGRPHVAPIHVAARRALIESSWPSLLASTPLPAAASGDAPLLSLVPSLAVPVVGLGAPASSYYGRTADLLHTTARLHPDADVANAIGAVVGSVRQQQDILIAPAGAKQVKVLFPEGPVVYDTLEAGAVAASERAVELARGKAAEAGADDITLSVSRQDNVVEQDGQRVFFESLITATACGRPASA